VAAARRPFEHRLLPRHHEALGQPRLGDDGGVDERAAHVGRQALGDLAQAVVAVELERRRARRDEHALCRARLRRPHVHGSIIIRRVSGSHARALVALATMYAAGGCAHHAAKTAAPVATPAPAPSREDELRREAIRQLQNIESMLDAVAVVRGLSLTTRPPIAVLDDARFTAACGEELRANIAQLTGTEGWHGPAAAAMRNPERNCTDLAALYDTHHDRVIIKRSSYDRRTRGHRVELLSHELEHAIVAHALPTAPPLHGVDELSALHALEEGDATVTSVAFLLSLDAKPLRDAIPRLLARIAAAEPKSLHDSSFFAYSLGARFVLELYQRGGFLAVNDAFARPPASTSEILHVDRYLAPVPPPNVAT